MTIKEIAQVANVEERTVRRWAEKAADKMSAIKDKMSASSPAYPADFTLPETIATIRAGGNETLADLLEQNAKEKPAKSRRVNGLPNGKQLEQFRLMMQAGGDQARLALHLAGLDVMGQGVNSVLFGHPGTTPLGLPVNPEVSKIVDDLMGNINRKDRAMVNGVANKAIEQAASREAINRLNGRLDFGGKN